MADKENNFETSASAYQQVAARNLTYVGKQAISGSFSKMCRGAFGDAANERFKASHSRGTYAFIVTDVSEGVGLVKVDKVSGKEGGKIILHDREPIYDSDPENGMNFYKSTKKEV